MENNQQYVIYNKSSLSNTLKLTKNLSKLYTYDKYIITVNGLSLLFIKTSSNSYKLTISNAPLDLRIENVTDYIFSYDYSSFNLFNFDNIKIVTNKVKPIEKTGINIGGKSSKVILINDDNQILNHDDIFLKMIFIKNIKYYSDMVRNNSIKKHSKIQKCSICNINKCCFMTNNNTISCMRCIIDKYFTI